MEWIFVFIDMESLVSRRNIPILMRLRVLCDLFRYETHFTCQKDFLIPPPFSTLSPRVRLPTLGGISLNFQSFDKDKECLPEESE